DWRVVVRGEGYWLYELAGRINPASWQKWAKTRMNFMDGEGESEWLEYADSSQGRYRCAQLLEGRLLACLFINRNHELPARDWLAGLFAETTLDAKARMGLLAGRPLSAADDQGRMVCACFSVGYNTINRAIRQQGCTTAAQIGVNLKAGTNCGSCIPEIKAMLGEAKPR
ncbi:MAG: (2Fe-2S)-binding protein, partial [Candidatus Methylumidiphilus sp.]